MTARYLTTFGITLAVCVGLTLFATLRIDPFGVYGNDSEQALSRIDQFYHMRTGKPLILHRRKPTRLLLGTSRTARISPWDAGLENSYNAALPGGTPFELRQLLAFSNANTPLEAVLVGLDFDSFFTHLPQSRQGFSSAQMGADGTPQQWLHYWLAHKRAAFSWLALRESYGARTAVSEPGQTTYATDGSWHRNKTRNIGPFGFFMISRNLLGTLEQEGQLAFSLDELAGIIEYCHSNSINCQLFITPIHLFHFEILREGDLIELWEQWHREIVALNELLAQQHSKAPLPLWGFNTVTPAVNEPIARPKELETPWFMDNVHFRPRFGQLMLQSMASGKPSANAGQLLRQQSVEQYLSEVRQLQRAYVEDDGTAVNSLKEKLKLQHH